MASEIILVKDSRILGPTINGKKPLLGLSNIQKRELLDLIKKDWRESIRLHFVNESGITSNGKIAWKPLSERHEDFKENNSYSSNILQMNSPSLSSRYQRSITTNIKNFSIQINFPTLYYGSNSNPANAGVHQFGYDSRNGKSILGMPQRRIVLQGFKDKARSRMINYLTGK